MSGIYPSLEDMKVDQMQQAQNQYEQMHAAQAAAITYPPQQPAQPPGYTPTAPPAFGHAYPPQQPGASGLYPSLEEYMGLALTPEMVKELMPEVGQDAVAVRPTASSMQVAPITGDNVGIRRAEIRQGVREVVLCKDQKGKMGLRVRGINKGVFIALVHRESPASLAGLRFGDQILQINGENVAGWDTDKVMKYLKNADGSRITMAIRDRPFERTITLQKDSTGHVGFVFKEGRITAIVKDSSAARNGVLIDHQLIEINGQNVVGLKDSETGDIIATTGRTVTITILPTVIYEHIVKSMGSSLVKKFMDHSIPDV